MISRIEESTREYTISIKKHKYVIVEISEGKVQSVVGPLEKIDDCFNIVNKMFIKENEIAEVNGPMLYLSDDHSYRVEIVELKNG